MTKNIKSYIIRDLVTYKILHIEIRVEKGPIYSNVGSKLVSRK